MVRVFEPPVYCYHEIVHNQVVVDRFRPAGRGLRRRRRRGARRRAADAVGPRLGARGRRRGPGQRAASSSTPSARWSPRSTTRSRSGPARATPSSTSATRATTRRSAPWPWRPDAVHLVESARRTSRPSPDPGRPGRLPGPDHAVAVDEWRGRAGRGPRPASRTCGCRARSDLCFATTNRQAALKAIAGEADAVVVIGSANSSNTLALERTAAAGRLPPGAAGQRCRRAARRPDRHRRRHRRRVGPRGAGARRSSTASPPPTASRRSPVTDEDEYFPLPRELRELLRAVSAAASVSLLAPRAGGGAAPGPTACRTSATWRPATCSMR